MTSLSIKTLITLANEFEQVIDSAKTIDSKGPLPISKKRPIEEIPETKKEQGYVEPSPETIRLDKRFPSFAMNMDFKEVVNKLRGHLENLFPNAHLGPIRQADTAGHSLGIIGRTPAEALHIYKQAVLFIRKHYPANEWEDITSGGSEWGHGSYSPTATSPTTPNWTEIRYPDEDAVMTFYNMGRDLTFKITTIEQ